MLFLVVPNSTYGDRVPLQVGTLQIDMMVDLTTEAELNTLGKTWKQSELSTHLAMKQAQLKEESFILDCVQGNVKLPRMSS